MRKSVFSKRFPMTMDLRETILRGLEQWMLEACTTFLDDERYEVKGINFSTYGASLMYLDEQGKRLTPVYNYLKPMPDGCC